jgi:ribosomal protein S18 acetylase RimI-like enzyme
MSENLPKTSWTLRELRKDDWPNVRVLFGKNGACGGCWCMHWRLPKGGKAWEAAKGEPNRRALKSLLAEGKVRGILAFDGSIPVGWCSFGRRVDFPRTETVKAYRRDDIENVWSINCFYVKKEYRRRGLVFLLAEAAVRAIRKCKGRVIEAYPVTLTQDGRKLPPAFSYTGPEIVFQRLGFREVQRLAPTRPLYRLEP